MAGGDDEHEQRAIQVDSQNKTIPTHTLRTRRTVSAVNNLFCEDLNMAGYQVKPDSIKCTRQTSKIGGNARQPCETASVRLSLARESEATTKQSFLHLLFILSFIFYFWLAKF